MKTLLLLLFAVAAYPADPKPLTPSQENEILKLQNDHMAEQLAMEKAMLPFRARMLTIERQWAEAVARMKKELGLPEACVLTPDRKWKCEDKKAEETNR